MTTQRRKTLLFHGRHPVIDSDFDDLGGELTLAQIRDPGLTLAQIWNPVSLTDGDPLRYVQRQHALINHRCYILRQLARRLKAASDFRFQIARKRERLQKLSRQFLMAQLKTYPKFNFGWLFPNQVFPKCKCNHCVPYNGHHTINYWATGQADCW